MSDERPLEGSLAIVTGALGKLGPVWVSHVTWVPLTPPVKVSSARDATRWCP